MPAVCAPCLSPGGGERGNDPWHCPGPLSSLAVNCTREPRGVGEQRLSGGMLAFKAVPLVTLEQVHQRHSVSDYVCERVSGKDWHGYWEMNIEHIVHIKFFNIFMVIEYIHI